MILTLSFALPVTIAESGSIQLAITLEKETHQSTQGERQSGRHTRRVCMNCCWFAFWRFPCENSRTLDPPHILLPCSLLVFAELDEELMLVSAAGDRFSPKRVDWSPRNVFVQGGGRGRCCLLTAARTAIDYWGRSCITYHQLHR